MKWYRLRLTSDDGEKPLGSRPIATSSLMKPGDPVMAVDGTQTLGSGNPG